MCETTRRPNEFRGKDSLFTKCQRSSRRVDERLGGRVTSCPYDRKLSFKADEPVVGQLREDKRTKLQNYHFIISLKKLDILHQERRGQVKIIVMEHFKSILFHKFGPLK